MLSIDLSNLNESMNEIVVGIVKRRPNTAAEWHENVGKFRYAGAHNWPTAIHCDTFSVENF